MLSEIIGNMINDGKVTISKTQGYAFIFLRGICFYGYVGAIYNFSNII